jgi:hypothetical protein
MDCDTEDAGTALRSVRPTESADESPEQAIARIREVRNRAEKMFEWRVEGDSLLDIALDHLTLGRTYLAEAELRGVREGEAPATGSLGLAREKLEETRRLVKETESKYEPHVPDWDEWQPPEYVDVFKQGDTVGYHCRNGEIERLQQLIDDGSS